MSDDPTMASRKVFLRLKANGDLVNLEAEGKAMSETVAAFDAAVAVLEAEAVAQQIEPAIQAPPVPELPRRNGIASEVRANSETAADQRSWLKRHEDVLWLIFGVATVIGALAAVIALF